MVNVLSRQWINLFFFSRYQFRVIFFFVYFSCFLHLNNCFFFSLFLIITKWGNPFFSVVYHFHQFKYNFFWGGKERGKWRKYFINMLCMHSAAPRFGVLNRTTLIDFHFACRFSCTRRWSNTILDFGSHSHESLLNVSCIFGGCLKEWNSQLISVFLQMENIWFISKLFRLKWYSPHCNRPQYIPLLLYDRQLSLLLNRICFQPAACLHFRMHSVRFLPAIA